MQYLEAHRFTETHTPELFRAYQAFAAFSQSGAPRQPFKGRDLWRILQITHPRSITELGSGTTSAVFALWAGRTATRYVAFEHDAQWAKVTEDCLSCCELLDRTVSRIKHVYSRVSDDQCATGFVEAIAPETDFVYVDGPPCRLADGRKVPNDDVTRLLDAGSLPRVIVVDGRIETVDLIRQHHQASRYQFFPSFVYSLRRRLWTSALAGREHTVFIRS